MGCFNVVCNLSGQPVYGGDKVKLIITLPARDRGVTVSICNPCDLRIPCFMPISGEYNDYGAIEKVQEDGNTALIDSFFKEAEVNGWLQYGDGWLQYGNRYHHHQGEQGIEKWVR